VGINFRHLGLLCDVMTRAGRLMSADRYGINKNDIGPVAKASFEETERILLRAALYGEMDPITGVSANIMMGQPIRGGTAFSQIMLDEQVLPGLLENVKPLEAIEEEEEAQDLDGMMMDDVSDACARTKFNMSMAAPTKMEKLMDEEDVELEVL
jgi:DNA-directed RNA polymerase II subunit RPB1